ncbi:MAG: prepilin-type N-terminal cleavage/methylation domain-containing protein [Mariprofundaceae bacterium]|nr:prepilin-type N-terminal cleavage/methylation domain-containing protein [Mariprofundaceae bacterium]
MKIESKQKGFTLIELMIVIAIIGILASIAIPQFASFRIKAFNSAAQADIKNGNTVIEAIYSDVFEYPANAVAITSAKFNWSSDVFWSASKDVMLGHVGSTSTYGIASKHKAGDLVQRKTRLTQFATADTIAAGTNLAATVSATQVPTAD